MSAVSMSAMKACAIGGTDLDRCSPQRSGRRDLNRCAKNPRWRWHLDEVFVKINGKQHYLWRAVNHEGEVLESYVTKRRDRKAALRFLKKAMKRYGNPEVVVTDRLASYRAAMKVIGNEDRQETARWANNRAENSHLPFRRRERAMLRFRQMRSLQKFASVHSFSPITTSINRETSNAEPDLKPSDTPLFSNGANFSLPNYGAQIGCWRPVRVRLTPPPEPNGCQCPLRVRSRHYGEITALKKSAAAPS